MILNKKFSLMVCVILLLLILVSVFTKKILYETFDGSGNSDYEFSAVDVSDFNQFIQDSQENTEQIDQTTIDGMRCLGRYNKLIDNYKKSLNSHNDLMRNANMPNAHYLDNPPSGISASDLENSRSCAPLYSVSDSHFYKTVAYDELYLNWLNISILRHFGNATCNHSCSNFLGINLHENESMGLENNIAPSLVSLHPIGLYNSGELNLPDSDNDDFRLISISNGTFRTFYRTLVKELYDENNTPAKRYFGIIYKDGTHIAYLAKQTGEIGLNKLVQACAVGNVGITPPTATLEKNSNVINLNNVPSNAPDMAKSVYYIPNSFFDQITANLPTEENVILVFGFFV